MGCSEDWLLQTRFPVSLRSPGSSAPAALSKAQDPRTQGITPLPSRLRTPPPEKSLEKLQFPQEHRAQPQPHPTSPNSLRLPHPTLPAHFRGLGASHRTGAGCCLVAWSPSGQDPRRVEGLVGAGPLRDPPGPGCRRAWASTEGRNRPGWDLTAEFERLLPGK